MICKANVCLEYIISNAFIPRIDTFIFLAPFKLYYVDARLAIICYQKHL